jgi:hypothetical protein
MGPAAQPSAGGLGPYPPRAAARRPSCGSSDAQSLASSSSEQLAARERRAARKVQREAMALRMTRSVLAPELRRMFVLRQSLKRWQSLKRCNAQRALLLFAQHEHATTALVRLQAIVRGRQARRRCAAASWLPPVPVTAASMRVYLYLIRTLRF